MSLSTPARGRRANRRANRNADRNPSGARGRGTTRAGGRLRRLRPTPRILAAVVLVALILAGGWIWLRRSALVSVQQVRVTGLSGPSVNAIRGALERTALTMTTLDINLPQLERVVRPYTVVRSLTVSRHFPHGLTIVVHEEVPVAAVSFAGRRVGVTASGQLVAAATGIGTSTGTGTSTDAGTSVSRLPTLVVSATPDDGHVVGAQANSALAVLGAAPYGFLSHVTEARATDGLGVVLALHDGPQLIFGPPTRLRAKWAAVVAVLGNADSHGASYINVSDPNRAAAGVPTASP